MKKIIIFFACSLFSFAIQAQKISFSLGAGISKNRVTMSGMWKTPMLKILRPASKNFYADVKYQFNTRWGIGASFMQNEVRYGYKRLAIVESIDTLNRASSLNTFKSVHGFPVNYISVYAVRSKEYKHFYFNVGAGISFIAVGNITFNPDYSNIKGLDHTIIYNQLSNKIFRGNYAGIICNIEAGYKLNKHSAIKFSCNNVAGFKQFWSLKSMVTVNNIRYDYALYTKGSGINFNLGYSYIFNMKEKDKPKVEQVIE